MSQEEGRENEWTIIAPATSAPSTSEKQPRYSPKYLEGAICELRLYGVLGSWEHRGVSFGRSLKCSTSSSEDTLGRDLLLATAVHIVVLASDVFVPAFTAIELVPLLIIDASKNIVAIPAIEDILSFTSVHTVVAVASVDDIVTVSSIEIVIGAAKATYLVIALLPVQHVRFVGAQEQTTLGAAG